MIDRDRIAEIIRNARMNANPLSQVGYAEADALLANDVIVPPCKVGEKVYFYKAGIDEICPAKVIGIIVSYYTPAMPLWIRLVYESKLIGKQEVKIPSVTFELLCSHTKKEAFQKLKELEK